MKILITGICGFVGSRLARKFAGLHEVFGIDCFIRKGSGMNKPLLEGEGIKVFTGDIRNPSDLDELPAADWVIDAAANPSVLAGVDGQTSSRELMDHNLIGTLNILEYCKKHSAGMILLSTSRVYGIRELARLPLGIQGTRYEFAPAGGEKNPADVSGQGITEEFSTQPPVSLYGVSKLASEQIALEYHYAFGFPLWINRCGVIAGAGQFGKVDQGIFSYWIHSWRESRPLKYIGFGGSGAQVRDCIHPDDIATLIAKQFAFPQDGSIPRIHNVAGGIENSMSLAELSGWCERRFGRKQIARDDSARPFDIPWMVMDSSRAKKQFAWEARRSLSSILDEIAQFAQENPDWISKVT
ncbi:NAD-dependent epimerase/dehydratase family protein [Kamptonema cortianum]|nr:NAD-dependent epimerase/dehydratase family protein [Oscillatoria laete-virens]MDK3159956.1 NAD-dependent epimerase/dehydratase family protein [Kamptonema cortianum]MDL5047179.1 NAD-dependent epimerase/dehydratase family protein [Oscillatoria amoena NRMC-F 0135]MDL5055489.1 NAD-dependent epimerase/dehydratase family protein [Oscillatoria laete-virens NRMC-F 0139]